MMVSDTRTMQDITVQVGIREIDRQRAADIYHAAFARKFRPFISADAERGKRLFAQGFNPAACLAAYHDGQLLGLTGFHHDGQHLQDFHFDDFQREFGLFMGVIRYYSMVVFERESPSDTLLMDGIAVHPDARGRGVGTLLLQHLFDFAREKGYKAIKLSVIDTNPGARRLYERMGFEATRTIDMFIFSHVFGFSKSTDMIKHLDGD